ncbi:MAG: hypothetical protein AAF125_07820, partial [Chloroflexota bacterium]
LRVAYPLDADEVADRLRRLLVMPVDARRAMGARLRARVVEQHSLDALIPKVVAALKATTR